jgi:O-antigen ligase
MPMTLTAAWPRYPAVAPSTGLVSADRLGRAFFLVVVAGWASSVAIGFRGALGLLTLFSIAMTAAGWFERRVGLLGLGMALTLDAVAREYLPASLFRFNTLNYLLVLSALCFVATLAERIDVHTKLLLGLTAVLVVGLFMSAVPEIGIQHVLALTSTFGVIGYFTRCSLEPRAWVWMSIVNGTISALGGLVMYAFAENTRGSQNVWVNFPLTGLISVCVGLMFVPHRGNGRFVLLGLAAMNYGWIFLSGSRGGLALATVCVAFVLFNARGVQRLWFAVAGAVLLASLILVYPDVAAGATARVSKLFDPAYSAAERTSGRTALALNGLDVFRENPLGVGTGAYVMETAMASSQTFAHAQPIQAHSGWIKTLTENGIAGIVLMIAFVGSFAVVGWRRGGEAASLGIFTTIVLSLGFAWTEFATKGLWLLAAATTVLINPARRRR